MASKRSGKKRKGAGARRVDWAELPKRELLDVRLCDLGLDIAGTWLEEPISRVVDELRARHLRVRPHFWLSDEWFVPDKGVGVAIPFFLAHPRLMRLERSEMLEVEGGTVSECLKVLRHELGHVVHHAYDLGRRRRWQRAFGRSSQRYPEYYRPNPASKRYVQNLDYWYAQSHPDEDFAETFAVWLKPRSKWRKRYESWPALRKLEYVDALMAELAGRKPAAAGRARVDPVSRLRTTLRQYYEKKRERYLSSSPDIYDRELRSLFSDDPRHRGRESAAAFLRRNRGEIRRRVARWTGEYEFTLDHVLKEMIQRCGELGLRAVGSRRQLKMDFTVLLTVKTMHHLYSERHWIPV